MNYIEQIAHDIRAEVPAAALPEHDVHDLFLLYALVLLIRGDEVDAEDVHNAWTAWMTLRGQRHPSMVPFAQLSAETQAEDAVFVGAIRIVAKRLSA